ncbi:MAG: hypothetical protein PHP88_04085, partial [bacterium]|nr:hypothetical protein [bacterium]
PLEGLIDFGQEAKRQQKEMEKTNAEYARVAGQLGNARFTANAPPDIVDALRDREKTLEQKIAKLGKNLELVSRYLA